MKFEEIQAELSKPEVVEKVISDEKLFPVISGAIGKKGYQILDEKSKTELLENYKKNELEKVIGEETNKLHSYYDNDLKEIYGESDAIKPRDGEKKTYHVNKRLHQENIKKIKDLEEKVAKGDHKEFYEGKLAEAEQKYLKAIETEQKKYQELEGKFSNTQKETNFIEAYTPVRAKFDPAKIDALGEDLFKDTERSVKEEIIKNSKIEEGKLVRTNPDGSVMKDENFKPVLVSDFLNKKFANLFKKEDAGGGGTGDQGEKKPADPDKITVETFDTKGAKTKSELIDALTSQGLSPGTPKFTEIYSHYVKQVK